MYNEKNILCTMSKITWLNQELVLKWTNQEKSLKGYYWTKLYPIGRKSKHKRLHLMGAN